MVVLASCSASLTLGRTTLTDACKRSKFGVPVTRPTPLTLMASAAGPLAGVASAAGLAEGAAEADRPALPIAYAPTTMTAAAAPTASGRSGRNEGVTYIAASGK